jgi:deoxyhypusine synthase
MAKQKEFRYLSAGEFTTVEGKLQGFRKNNNGVAIVVETDKELLGIGLNSILKSLVKQANKDGVLSTGVEVKLVKGNKAEGKKYFLSELYVNGEKIEEQTIYGVDDFAQLFD